MHHLDPNLTSVVEVDALNTGIGAILSQHQGTPPKLYPCALYSCKLNPAEQNYDVGNRELLAMKAAFEEWWHWLEGAKDPFLVLTDHQILEYLRSAMRLNPRQASWALFFIHFHFTITYRPGTKNIRADSLSHQHDADTQNSTLEPIISTSLIVAPVHWDIMTEITQAHKQDPPPPECPPNPLQISLMCQVIFVTESFSGFIPPHVLDTLVSQELCS